jgi:DNA polymerase III delta prime subunit
MERYVVHRLENLTKADGAERVEAYLRANGVTTMGVQVKWSDELQSAAVIALADRDPGDLLRAYTTTQTAGELERDRRLSDARQVIQSIAAKPRADRTPVERALLGLAVSVRNLEVDG